MATSTMSTYVNRSGYDILRGSHTGLGASALNERFNLPYGTWSIHQVSVVLIGDYYTMAPQWAPGATQTGALDQSCALYHLTADDTTVQLYPFQGYTWFQSGDYRRILSFGSTDLNLVPGDYLNVVGADIDTGTGGSCEIYCSSIRLQ